MTDYGIQPTGYIRKPLSVTLSEIEAAMVTEFGPGVIQTSQSPFGQLNGLVADLISEIDEQNLDLYQSYDPDQAEGNRLDILGRIRLVRREVKGDAEYRKEITNDGQARVDIQDLAQSVASISGVTFSRVYVNETGETTPDGLTSGSVSIVVEGGDDQTIAEKIRLHVVPGITTYGNTFITSLIGGYCRTQKIVRPIKVPVKVQLTVKFGTDRNNCPPPSTVALKNYIVETWLNERSNGKDVSHFNVRNIVESTYESVEVQSIRATRGENFGGINEPAEISFIEIASLSFDDITVIST